MTQGKPYPLWPGADDKIVIEEMLRDSNSGQWYECREFVKKYVQIKAKNIPQDRREDIVQDAMIRVSNSLPTFQHQCSLKTWLFRIVLSCIIDDYRKFALLGRLTVPLSDPHDDTERESDTFTANIIETVEDTCVILDDLNKAVAALREYVLNHAHPIRNGQIIHMVLFEGSSLEEAARAVGCSAPVAGYVVRTAQRYVREKLGHQQP